MSKKEGLIEFGSGATAGLIADLCSHPLDTIRARLQSGVFVIGENKVKNNKIIENVINKPKIYRNTFHAIYNVAKNEGIKGLYSGFSSVGLLTVPAHAIYFYTYERSKRIFDEMKIGEKDLKEYPNTTYFVSGFIAEMFGALVWTPMDLMKQRLQIMSNTAKKPSLIELANSIMKTDGFFGMFRGFTAGILVYGPFVGVYFTVYENYKKILKKRLNLVNDSDMSLINCFIGGGIAGSSAALITNPLDVVKTKLQITNKNDPNAYRSLTQAIIGTYKTNGIKGFGLGLTARILWCGPSCAITIAAYEKVKVLYSSLFSNNNNIVN
eukprot:TRINITY_DN41_c2_g1_i1.p1 TRINITY_DN41_c2_g1~~TRINITY_DN41_c2_g1_i1.p1  ORF type:complete len:324 (-),score=82.65 TRINITY_DN41_c2_g1_i1:1251-2222(-)